MSLIVGLEHCPATGALVQHVIPSTFIGNPKCTGHEAIDILDSRALLTAPAACGMDDRIETVAS
jgi:hypothetical protein